MGTANPPRVLGYAETFYDALESHSDDNNLYRGYTTALYQEVGLPIGHYTKVKITLEDMGCIVVEKRGKRETPSEWWLIGRPTLEQYEATDFSWEEDTRYDKLVQRIVVLEQQVKDLLQTKEGQ
jgi:hypothetical protein